MGISIPGLTLGKEYARTDQLEIEPEHIVPSPECNGRHVKPDRSEVWADMDKNGQHTPCEVKKENGVMVLYVGYGRWEWCLNYNKRERAAAEKEGRKPLIRKLKCIHFSGDALEAFNRTVAENRFRNGTVELDDAFNVRRYIDVLTQTFEQVAEIYFPGRLSAKFPNDTDDSRDDAMKACVKWVKKVYAKGQTLAGASPALLKEIRAGKVAMPAALHVAQLDETRQKALIAKAKETGKRIDTPKEKPEGPTKPTLKAVLAEIERQMGPECSPDVKRFATLILSFAAGEIQRIELD